MAKREFLQLAHTLNLDKHPVAGKFISEKLDGLRFFWDGGVTRGMPVGQVPWANLEKSNAVPYSTGLWSRYGKVINAPNFWLDALPEIPLEGELWTNFQEFQTVSSIVRSNVNVKEDEWHTVKAKVLDMPLPSKVFADGEINNTNYKKTFKGFYDFYLSIGGKEPVSDTTPFQSRYRYLELKVPENSIYKIHRQVQLPFGTTKAIEAIYDFENQVLSHGGEGVVIKAGNDLWRPERCYSVLKRKPWLDSEAVVVGYQGGRRTDKGSKHIGKMGSLICEIPEGRFRLSGFTDDERILVWSDSGKSAEEYVSNFEGSRIPDLKIINPKFPLGSVVTYKYREVTDAGLPKEARFWRKHG